jgi:hypothetical protein
VKIIKGTTDRYLADYLNDGWGILHIQFVDTSLNVVLQREVPVPPVDDTDTEAAKPETTLQDAIKRIQDAAPSIHDPLPTIRTVQGSTFIMPEETTSVPVRELSVIQNAQPPRIRTLDEILADPTLTPQQQRDEMNMLAFSAGIARGQEIYTRLTTNRPTVNPFVR